MQQGIIYNEKHAFSPPPPSTTSSPQPMVIGSFCRIFYADSLFDCLLGKTSRAYIDSSLQPFEKEKKSLKISKRITSFTQIDPDRPARVLVYFLSLLFYFIKFHDLNLLLALSSVLNLRNFIAKYDYGSNRTF